MLQAKTRWLSSSTGYRESLLRLLVLVFKLEGGLLAVCSDFKDLWKRWNQIAISLDQ